MGFVVAVIIGEDGKTASPFQEGASLEVFSRETGSWRSGKKIGLVFHPEKGLRAVREEIKRIIGGLPDVRILAAGEISGVVYHTFDTAGYSIFQIPDKKPADFLDFVVAGVKEQEEEMEALKTGKSAKEEIPSPKPAGEEGIYYLDMIEAQRADPNVTTKQMLKPFLQHTKFYELKVICSHLPIWFDRELAPMKLAYEKETLGPEKYKVTIHAATCE